MEVTVLLSIGLESKRAGSMLILLVGLRKICFSNSSLFVLLAIYFCSYLGREPLRVPSNELIVSHAELTFKILCIITLHIQMKLHL